MSRTKNALEAQLGAPPEFGADRPKGEQVHDHLAALIRRLPPGAILPSETTMAQHFGVARMTLRQQIDVLAAEGLVVRVVGRGTFVTEPRFIQTEVMSSFSRDMRARGMEPGSNAITVRVCPADALVAAKLEISDGDDVVQIARVRTANGMPMAWERANLPAARFPGLETVDLERRSLYEQLEQRYHVYGESAEQRVSVISLTEAEAHLLGARTGEPAFLIERVTRDNMGKVIEFGKSIYRGDRYDVLMHIGLRTPRKANPPTPGADAAAPAAGIDGGAGA
jgi:GntR family transcriptional regulator